jgi:hypothetical protein
MTTTFTCEIATEPVGLLIVTDREGDAWQRQEHPPRDSKWVCVRPKFQGLLGSQSSATTWRHLVYSFGPITAVQWAPDVEELS